MKEGYKKLKVTSFQGKYTEVYCTVLCGRESKEARKNQMSI